MEEQEFTNNDIPLETLLKYIKRDRDKYKKKVEGLMPHVHDLENRIVKLQQKNEMLQEQLSDSRTDIQRSPVFKQLFEKYSKLKKEKEYLIEQLCTLRAEKRNEGFFDKLFKRI